MDELARSIKPVLVHWRIPALQWIRLCSLAWVRQRDVDDVAIEALRAGLDALGVSADVEGLLDSAGDFRSPEEGDRKE